MIIVLAADHAGFKLKQEISSWLSHRGIHIVDVGADRYMGKDDYPVYAKMGVRAVLHTKEAMGIFICGSGVGMAIVANRYPRIRAVCAESVSVARRSRDEDDTNVLTLGARVLPVVKAKKIISVWMRTRFSGQSRHKRRLTLLAKR